MTAPRTSAKSTPAKKVDLDLDALDIDISEPMTVRFGGKVIRLLDARDIDWQVAAMLTAERPFELISSIVHPEDQEHFLSVKASRRTLELLLERYQEHFGLGSEGESGAS